MTKATIAVGRNPFEDRCRIVITNADKLGEIANAERGDLGRTPFFVLLLALTENRRTCLLKLQRRALSKEIQFEAGVPVQCRSNVLHHTFGGFLVAEGRIPKPVCEAAFEESSERGVPLGEVLIEAGLLTSDEVLASLQRLLAKSLLDAFTWSDGEFEILARRAPISAPLNVRVHQLILTGIRRFVPQTLVDREIESIGDTTLRWSTGNEERFDVRLGAAERQLRAALAEPASITELSESAGLDRDDLSRSLLALTTLGIVLPESAPRQQRPTNDQQAPSLAEPPNAAARAEPAEPPIEAESLSALYLDHRRMTPYELLSASEDDSTDTIERRFLEYSLQLAHWITREDAQREVRAKAMELLLAGARAYTKVADEESRERLRLSGNAGDLDPQSAGAVVEMLDSERQYQQGLELMESGQFATAYEKLEFASEADPQRGLYRAQAAYCRYLKTPELAEEVLRSLAETHRVDPTCGLAFLYAGEIAGRLERFEEAQSLLRQASKLMAPDRRPIEKLKELKQRMRSQ
jgi:tetratricopeptide (TPR) repeat protein